MYNYLKLTPRPNEHFVLNNINYSNLSLFFKLHLLDFRFWVDDLLDFRFLIFSFSIRSLGFYVTGPHMLTVLLH